MEVIRYLQRGSERNWLGYIEVSLSKVEKRKTGKPRENDALWLDYVAQLARRGAATTKVFSFRLGDPSSRARGQMILISFPGRSCLSRGQSESSKSSISFTFSIRILYVWGLRTNIHLSSSGTYQGDGTLHYLHEDEFLSILNSIDKQPLRMPGDWLGLIDLQTNLPTAPPRFLDRTQDTILTLVSASVPGHLGHCLPRIRQSM